MRSSLFLSSLFCGQYLCVFIFNHFLCFHIYLSSLCSLYLFMFFIIFPDIFGKWALWEVLCFPFLCFCWQYLCVLYIYVSLFSDIFGKWALWKVLCFFLSLFCGQYLCVLYIYSLSLSSLYLIMFFVFFIYNHFLCVLYIYLCFLYMFLDTFRKWALWEVLCFPILCFSGEYLCVQICASDTLPFDPNYGLLTSMRDEGIHLLLRASNYTKSTSCDAAKILLP